MVVSLKGSVLLSVNDGKKTLRKPRCPAKLSRTISAILPVPDLSEDPIEDAPEVDEDPVDEIDTEVGIDNTSRSGPISDHDPAIDDGFVSHEGHVLYRIRSSSPEHHTIPRKRRHEVLEANNDHLYAWDVMEHQDHDTNIHLTLSPRLGRPNRDIAVLAATEPALKRSRLDSSQHVGAGHKHRKVVRIELPPDHGVRRDRRLDVEHLKQLRTAPALVLPRHRETVVPPPVAYRPANVSTDAFYRAMGGPPPSDRPLPSVAQPPATYLTQAAAPRSTQHAGSRSGHPVIHPSRLAVPGHVSSMSRDSRQLQPAMPRLAPVHTDRRHSTVYVEPDNDVFQSRPNPFAPAPSVRFDHQRYMRDGQAGPSNERFLPEDDM